MKKARFLSLTGAMVLAGCAAPALIGPAGKASLTIIPRVSDDRSVQIALAQGYLGSDIEHFDIKLFKVVDGLEQPVLDGSGHQITATGAGTASGKALTIGSLQSNATYRLKAYAYKAAGSDPADLISDPASSSVDVSVTTDDRPTVASLPVTLINKLFSGAATSSIALTEGSLLSPGAIQTRFGMLVTTIAGSTSGYADGTGSQAKFGDSYGVDFDSQGNLFIADHINRRVRKMTPEGVVTTLAGNGNSSSTNGTGTGASFTSAVGLTVDPSDNVFMNEHWSYKLRKITPAGVVTTFAGGTAGDQDGTGAGARFGALWGLASDASGNIYATDITYQKIRKFTPTGVMTTLAGSTSGYQDGNGTNAKFNQPYDIDIDSSGNLYVADTSNHRIRKIAPNGDVTTFAGSGTPGNQDGRGTAATFSSPYGLTILTTGDILVGQLNGYMRLISKTGDVATVAGALNQFASVDGRGDAARIGMTLYLATGPGGEAAYFDLSSYKIRFVTY